MASLMRGSEELQSASCPACAGIACKKSLTSGCAACSRRSSPVKLTYAPWRCSRLLRMLSRSACTCHALSAQMPALEAINKERQMHWSMPNEAVTSVTMVTCMDLYKLPFATMHAQRCLWCFRLL